MSIPDEILDGLRMADDKLKSARILLDAGQFADAASRAYYCAFHSISATLLSRNLSFSTHRQTIGAFNREFVSPASSPSISVNV